MPRSGENLEKRIERMPFDALKSKCDSVVEDWRSKSAIAPGLVDRPGGRVHSGRNDSGKSCEQPPQEDESTGVGEVVSVFEARIDHLEKKLLGMQNEHRRQLRYMKRSYWLGIAGAIMITVILIGASFAVQLF